MWPTLKVIFRTLVEHMLITIAQYQASHWANYYARCLGLGRKYEAEICIIVIRMNGAFQWCPFWILTQNHDNHWISIAFGQVQFLAKMEPKFQEHHLKAPFMLTTMTQSPASCAMKSWTGAWGYNIMLRVTCTTTSQLLNKASGDLIVHRHEPSPTEHNNNTIVVAHCLSYPEDNAECDGHRSQHKSSWPPTHRLLVRFLSLWVLTQQKCGGEGTS